MLIQKYNAPEIKTESANSDVNKKLSKKVNDSTESVGIFSCNFQGDEKKN